MTDDDFPDNNRSMAVIAILAGALSGFCMGVIVTALAFIL